MPMRLPGREAVEVYVTEGGQVAIKQVSYESDDAIIFLEPQDVPVITKMLNAIQGDAAKARQEFLEKEDEAEEAKPAPTPGTRRWENPA